MYLRTVWQTVIFSSPAIDVLKSAACVVATIYLASYASVSPFLLGTAAAIAAIGSSQATLAYDSIIVKNADRQSYISWNSKLQSGDLKAMVVGPMLGISFTYLAGPRFLLVASATIYLANVVNIALMKFSADVVGAARRRVISEITESFRFLGANPRLLAFSIVFSLNNLMIGIIEAAGVSIVKKVYLLGDKEFGLMNLVAGLIGSVAILGFPRLHKGLSLQRIGLWAATAFSVACLLISVEVGFIAFLISYGIMIASTILMGMYPRDLRAKLIPTEDYGKISSLIMCMNQLSIPMTGAILVAFPDSRQLLSLIGALAVVFVIASIMVFRGAERRYSSACPATHALA